MRGNLLKFKAHIKRQLNYNTVIKDLFFLKQGSMPYWALFEGKTPFNKLWLSFDNRAKLDLRLKKISYLHYFAVHLEVVESWRDLFHLQIKDIGKMKWKLFP